MLQYIHIICYLLNVVLGDQRHVQHALISSHLIRAYNNSPNIEWVLGIAKRKNDHLTYMYGQEIQMDMGNDPFVCTESPWNSLRAATQSTQQEKTPFQVIGIT